MHYGFVAVPSTVDQLVNAFADAWPKYELSDRTTLRSMDEYFSWKRARDRRVPAKDWTPQTPEVEVYGFVQDGKWAAIFDTSYVLCANEEALSKLSEVFGSCVAFVIETAGGCASFTAFAKGHLTRRIESVDGKVTTVGDPIPEEVGLRVDRYYMDETEELQRRLGFSFLGDSPPTEVLAVATIDRTDYTALLDQNNVARDTGNPKKKSWWRFW